MKYKKNIYFILTLFILVTMNKSFGFAQSIVVWNGETVSTGSGWSNPSNTCNVKSQEIESHSAKSSVEFRFKGDGKTGWLGCGWDWVAFQVGEFGTDITAMKNFSFWLKVKGTSAEMSFNLLCNGAPALDQPQHHTEKVLVSKYCADWKNGEWHKIIVPLKDLVQPEGFDARHVAEMQFFNTGAGDGSFYVDDLAFDGGSKTNP
jgi:hypothetical protein